MFLFIFYIIINKEENVMEINYMCISDILQYLTKNLTISDKGVMNGIKQLIC